MEKWLFQADLGRKLLRNLQIPKSIQMATTDVKKQQKLKILFSGEKNK